MLCKDDNDMKYASTSKNNDDPNESLYTLQRSGRTANSDSSFGSWNRNDLHNVGAVPIIRCIILSGCAIEVRGNRLATHGAEILASNNESDAVSVVER